MRPILRRFVIDRASAVESLPLPPFARNQGAPARRRAAPDRPLGRALCNVSLQNFGGRGCTINRLERTLLAQPGGQALP
jgi:hypothetical protein